MNDDKKSLKELATLAGGWEALAGEMWPLLSNNKQKSLKSKLETSGDDQLKQFFYEACAVKGFAARGRPNKYKIFGMYCVWQAIEVMKARNIGNSKIDRLKKVICYVIDPVGNRITGLDPSVRDRLLDETTKGAVPKIDLKSLAAGHQKPNKAIATFSKHLSTHTKFFKKLTAPYRANG